MYQILESKPSASPDQNSPSSRPPTHSSLSQGLINDRQKLVSTGSAAAICTAPMHTMGELGTLRQLDIRSPAPVLLGLDSLQLKERLARMQEGFISRPVDHERREASHVILPLFAGQVRLYHSWCLGGDKKDPVTLISRTSPSKRYPHLLRL
ncbi:uncharacterized protein BJX67DRAFT_149547 [Aspergillus lucknowensis]|uniref:Uncharacterized protein n=1 Tax=Aspergillus lucknowensis TaxID=176173 RepID=A0ABR4LN46_9EURO